AAISTEIPKAFGPEATDAAAPHAAAAARPTAPDRSLSRRRGASARVAPGAAAAPNAVIRNGPQLLASFDGINHRDQRTTNGGNQFSLEPPDQGLCVGG